MLKITPRFCAVEEAEVLGVQVGGFILKVEGQNIFLRPIRGIHCWMSVVHASK